MAPAPIDPWPRTAELDGGRLLRVGGIDVTALVAEHGSPLVVLDRAELTGRLDAFRAAFGPDVPVVYAAKALCTTAVLQLVDGAGLWLDCASGGELATAAAAEFPPQRTILHGNNKSAEELTGALDAGVARVVVDSLSELALLVDLAAGRDAPVDVLIRVSPGMGAGHHAKVHTGQDDSKFGLPIAGGLARQAVEAAASSDRIALRGIHCHLGSQITDPELFAQAVDVMCAFAAEVRDHLDDDWDLDVGGGLGIAHVPGEATLDVEAYAEALRTALDDGVARYDLTGPRLMVEPGRSLVGPAGVTIYTVGAIKDVPGVRTWVAVDGGMSDNPRPALYGAEHLAVACGPADAEVGDRVVRLVGKHCESGDVLVPDAALPADLARGDLVALAATGAYTLSMASNYNRLPRPALVLVGDGASRVIVRRETHADVLALDEPLDGPLGG